MLYIANFKNTGIKSIQFPSQRLLDLCIKFFQEFVTWKVSQNERKPEPVESTLPSAAELETHGPIQGSTGYYSLNSYRNLGLRPMQE